MKKIITTLTMLAIIGLSLNAQTAYITNYGANTVSVINLATNIVTTTIPVGNQPYGVSVSPDGEKVYVVNGNGGSSGSVSIINTATNNVTATITVGTSGNCPAISPDGSKVYVTNWNSSSVSAINTATNTVTATITVGSNPDGICMSPDGSKVYVANGGDNHGNTVSVINTATNTVSATITVGTNPDGIAVSPNGSTVYVANQNSNSVSVIDAATNTVTATITVGNFPIATSLSPDGSKLYVSNHDDGTVSVINTTTNTVSTTITVGSGPFGISFIPSGNNVYVANENSNSVSVINSATNTVSATIAVGDEPVAWGNFIASTVCDTPIDVSITNLNSSYTTTDLPVTLIGNPTGGTFYGTGVYSGVFYPNTLAAGNYNLAYAYTNSNGCSGVICQSVTVSHGAGIKPITPSNNGILIYPNPSNTNVTIESTTNNKDAMILIYNIQGDLLQQQPMLQAKTNIDISAFATGVYFVKVKTANGMEAQKIVKE
jgi:YVTN family beta-propeller protein